MTVSLAIGREARARVVLGIPVKPSIPPAFPLTMVEFPESDPETWPQYVLVRNDEDGTLHVVDVDCSLEWDGWRLPEFDQVEGGDL